MDCDEEIGFATPECVTIVTGLWRSHLGSTDHDADAAFVIPPGHHMVVRWIPLSVGAHG